MAGAAYFRARTLLQEQAVTQSQNLLSTQLKIIDREVTNKETHLEHLLESSDFTILTELALHANPKSNEFREIRNGILQEFNNLNAQEECALVRSIPPAGYRWKHQNCKQSKMAGGNARPFDFRANMKNTIPLPFMGFHPIYENEFILVTAQPYKTERGSTLGSIVGITEKKNLQKLIQPLNGLSPLATTYFVLSDQQFVYNDPETGEFSTCRIKFAK